MTTWTEAKIARLRKLWATMPTAEIGLQLGMSKNAVIGKAHRLGLQELPSPIRHTSAKPPPIRRVRGAETLPPLPSTLQE